MKKPMFLVATITLLLLVVLGVFQQIAEVSANTFGAGSSGMDWMFWVAVLGLIGLAGASMMGRAGTAGAWALAILVAFLVIKFLSGVIFGGEASKIESSLQKGMAAAVTGGAPGMSATRETSRPDTTIGPVIFRDGETTVYVSFERVERTVYIPLHKCVEYSPAEKVQVIESRSTYIILRPLEPVVMTLRAHQQGKPPCPPV